MNRSGCVHLLFILGLILFPKSLCGIDNEFQIQHISTPEGASSYLIAPVFEDSNGWMWLTTDEGLIAYDGKRKNMIDHRQGASHIGTRLIDSYALNKNQLILLTDKYQFLLFDTDYRKVIEIINMPRDYSSEDWLTDIQHAVTDNEFFLLCRSKITNEYKLFLLENSSFIQLEESVHAKSNASIIALKEKLYLISQAKVSIIDEDDKWLELSSFEFVHNGYTKFQADSINNFIWISNSCNQNNCRLQYIDLSKNKLVDFSLPFPIDPTTHYTLYPDGESIWIAQIGKLYRISIKDGIIKEFFEGIQKHLMTLESVPTISHYLDITKSRNGHYWLTSGYGLVQLIKREETFKLKFNSAEEFCESYCSMRGIAKEGNSIFYAHYGGIIEENVEIGTFSKVALPRSVSLNEVYSLSANKNDIFINDLEISRKDLSIRDLIPNNLNGHVTNYLDRNGILWLFTCCENEKGISFYKYDTKSKQKIDAIVIPNSIKKSQQITSIFQNQDDTKLYLATADNGAFIYDIPSNSFNQIINKKEVNGRLSSIVKEKTEVLWFGTNQGILKYNTILNTLKFVPFDSFNLDNSNIEFFEGVYLKDHIWWGTNQGLILFDVSEERFYTTDHLGAIGKYEYNRQSSLKINEEIFLGTTNGVVTFNHDNVIERLSDTTATYPLGISNISYFNGGNNEIQTIDWLQLSKYPIVMDYNDSNLNIEAGIPFYRSDIDISYSYLIEGYDNILRSIDAPMNLTVNHLNPGNYTIQLFATLGQSNIQLQRLDIPLIVKEAWFRTTLFYLFSGALLFGLGYGIFYYRYRETLKFQELRDNISDDLHDEVGSLLTGVAMQSELLMYSLEDEKYKPMAVNISEKSREALGKMRDTVWAINSKKDSIRSLESRMLDFLEEMFSNRSIEYYLHNDIKDKTQDVLPNVRQTIYLIFKEGITNILKHSDASMVQVYLKEQKKTIVLIIQDNGRKKSDIKKSGIGLESIKRRVTKLSGTFDFSYSSGYRLTVTLRNAN